jgi:hypothetical protein
MYSSFLSRCVLVNKSVRDIEYVFADVTSAPGGSALVVLSKQVCYPVWVLFSSAVGHLAGVSYQMKLTQWSTNLSLSSCRSDS